MTDAFTFTLGYYFLFAVIALVCEYVDSALGGGYGTILVPVLLTLNVDLIFLIPAVLFTEVWTGFGSGILHHCVGNANFKIKRDNGKLKSISIAKKSNDIDKKEGVFSKLDSMFRNSEYKINSFFQSFSFSTDIKIVSILALCGIVGGIIAPFIALNISDLVIKTYIGILVILVGLLVFIRLKWKFTWWKITGIGLLAAFNKGLSGGGYGPLISSGQIIVDRNPKQAIASTSLSEGVVCVSSLIVYATISGITLNPAFGYFILALLTGSLLSVPLAVLTVKYVPIKRLQPIIGIGTILLGIITLMKVYLPLF